MKVKARFGKPATSKAIAAAEKTLGRPLPPSLAAFLPVHDGLSVHWVSTEHPFHVAFEIQPLRAMIKDFAMGRDDLVLEGDTLLLPIVPRIDRWVVGMSVAAKSEGAVVESLDPPDSVLGLAPNFGAFLKKSAASFFVVTGRSDVSEVDLPAIRRAFRS